MRRSTKAKEPEQAYTIIAIPDVHVPAHDGRAIRAVAKYLATRHVDALVQLGDLVDHESISRFVKESPKKIADGHLLEEWALARRVMKTLLDAARAVNPKCLYYQLEGNHETRTKLFEDRYPMLRGMFDLSKHLDLEARGGVWVESDSKADVLRFEWMPRGITPIVRNFNTRIRDLYYGAGFVHGWSFGMHNAKAHTDASPFAGVLVYGHTHTRQLFTANRWGLDKPIAVSSGWLGLPTPEYALRGKANRWEQAFTIVTMRRDIPGDYDVDVPRIIDGAFIGPDGFVYDGGE